MNPALLCAPLSSSEKPTMDSVLDDLRQPLEDALDALHHRRACA